MAQPPADSGRAPVGTRDVRPYGKYVLVQKLAEGGMAEIFLAKQVGVEGFEKNVVIKRMLAHLSQVPDFVSMFLDEARLAASLSHPNIVQISDLGLADGCYYICMEYLAGEDFATVCRTAKKRGQHVPLNITLRVVAEAAQGLHFAHEATDASGRPLSIVHRDISPSNIFLTYNGQVKVLDFGIAKAESRVTQTTAGVVKGKYQYMSPEQAGSGAVDRRADVYSLGVSLYEALTGVRPFAKDTDLAILNAVLKHEYPPIKQFRPDLHPEVEGIVNKAMAARAEDRYQTAGELSADIERFLGATTSGSGGLALANFMKGFFGEARMTERTRIQTLPEMQAVGVDVPLTAVTAGAYTAPTRVDGRHEEPTRAVGPPKATVTQEGLQAVRPRRGGVVLAVVAALLLGVAGAVLGIKYLGGPAVKPLEPLPPPLVDAGPAPVAEVDAGVVDAGAAAAAVEDAGAKDDEPRPVKQRPVVLTTAAVQKVVGANKARIQRCFKDNKRDLPGQKGSLKVQFTIASSGKVSQVQTELEGTQVARCVAGVVKAMRFPPHVDQEVRVPIALGYDVQ